MASFESTLYLVVINNVCDCRLSNSCCTNGIHSSLELVVEMYFSKFVFLFKKVNTQECVFLTFKDKQLLQCHSSIEIEVFILVPLIPR